MALTWQQKLDAASSEAAVVKVAEEFVAQLHGDVVERLPADMRPGKFRDASEVTAYAFSVALHRLKGGGAEIVEQVQVIATFFMSAATRLTQIMTTRSNESREP